MPQSDETAGHLKDQNKQRRAEVTSLYRAAFCHPVPLSGDLSLGSGGKVNAKTKWRFNDVDMDKKIVFEIGHCVEQVNGQDILECTSPSVEVNESIVSTTTSRGVHGFRAIHKKISKGEKKQDFLEIWNHSRRLWVYDVDAKGLHDRILTKSNLVSAEWSPSEMKFLFVAEKKVPKKESFFCKEPPADSEQGTKFRWEEDWGEQVEGVKCPVVVVLTLPAQDANPTSDLEVEVIKKDDVSLGQAIFTPDEKGVVFVGMPNGPYRLGSIFCNNRLQSLYHYDFNTKAFTEIGPKNSCVFSPRFTGTGERLVFLQNEVGGPHLMASKLLCMDWSQKTTQVIVPIPEKPKEDEFPGLYMKTDLPRYCSSPEGDLIYLESQWHSISQILQIDLESKTVKNITEKVAPKSSQALCSWQLFSVHEDRILAACASPVQRPVLALGHVDPKTDNVKWVFSNEAVAANGLASDDTNRPNHPKLETFEVDLIKVTVDGDQTQYFESIYVHPKGKKHRLVVIPHGGPHGISNLTYSPFYEFLLNCGFGLLLVNYRGSIGFGEANLRSLPGHVGDIDVHDMHVAVTRVKALDQVTQTVLWGVSHGGFLNAHLVGQFPSDWSACVLLNPVIDLSMLGPSDIPDWYWFEGGCKGTFHHDSLPSDEDLVKLKACSPIAHANKITTPCFFFLGTEDRRVDKGQGLKLFKHLRARGIEVRCNMYTDNHSLGTVENSADMSVNSVLWFDRFYDFASNKDIRS